MFMISNSRNSTSSFTLDFCYFILGSVIIANQLLTQKRLENIVFVLNVVLTLHQGIE